MPLRTGCLCAPHAAIDPEQERTTLMMAKMFYTIEEAAEKLGKTEDEVKEMAKSGQIQEFRDRDKLMFKVDQIDLLAGDGDDDEEVGPLTLEDSRGGSGIALADSELGMSDSREGTGISVFDTDHGGDDESDQTQVGDTVEDELNLESVGSGSGLLDLTRESDDTALGAELLEDAYSADDNIEIPANASGLFEAASDSDSGTDFAPARGAAAVPMMIETYDGAGSGLGVGMMAGAIVALVLVTIIVVVGFTNATPAPAMTIGPNLWMWVGGLAGVTLLLGAVGWFIGKASE